jgi:hypothetical protein
VSAPAQFPPEELLELADPYALHALDEQETQRVEDALAATPSDVRAQFEARVLDVRETMAAQAAGYPESPAPETFDRILGELVSESGATPLRRRAMQALAAAAVLIVAVAAGVLVGRGIGTDTAPGTPDSSAVLAAPDARSTQARVGDATISLVYSRDYNAAVLLMNDVPPPQDGTVYQMWLMDPGGGARSRGTMTQQDVRPTTSAAVPGLDGATTFGISIEAPGGAQTPSDRIVVTLPIAGN